MSQSPNKRCGACLLFNTPKCTFLYSYEVETKTKEVDSWKEFIEWLYDGAAAPLTRTKLVRNTILPTDVACAHFIRESDVYG